MKTTVVNKYHGKGYDVWIGRGSKWYNPFSHLPSKYPDIISVDSREEARMGFIEYVKMMPELQEAARRELKGKVLGCCCKPKWCHGDIWAAIANDEEWLDQPE